MDLAVKEMDLAVKRENLLTGKMKLRYKEKIRLSYKRKNEAQL